MDFKQFSLSNLQKYTSPQAIKDFDRFLDGLPLAVGVNALVAAGITCLMGGAAVWFAAAETQNVGKLHAELMSVQALQPPVPVLKYTPVSQKDLSPKIQKIVSTFKGIMASGTVDGEVTLSAPDTDYFPQFLAAISYLQNGDQSWKVRINTLCVGRDCKSAKLTATMKVEKVTVAEPVDTSKDKDKDNDSTAGSLAAKAKGADTKAAPKK